MNAPLPDTATQTNDLLAQLRDPELSELERERITALLVESHWGFVTNLARKYADRGEPLEDLIQVAGIGLLKSIERFDPQHQAAFTTFATPTIVGEIRRHFRDRAWAIRVPRRLQELSINIRKARNTMSLELGHAPTVAELAAHLDTTEDEILAGLESAQAYATTSIHTPITEDGATLSDLFGEEDLAIALVENRQILGPALAQLPAEARRIVVLRFFGQRTQSQIATEVNTSQAQVSRTLTRALAQLRSALSQ